MVSRYLLYSILKDGRKKLWLFSLSLVALSGHHHGGQVGGWGFVFVSLEAVLTCIVKCGKCMRLCVVSMTILLFLIKFNPMIGPLNFFIMTKFSANVLSPKSNSGVTVDNGFSSWPSAICDWKLEGSLMLRRLFGACCFIVSNSLRAIELTCALDSIKDLLLDCSRNPEAHTAFLVCVSALLLKLLGDTIPWSAHLSSTFPQDVGCYCERRDVGISVKGSY